MTVRRKGSRRITVEGVEYLWRFPRKPRHEWDGNCGVWLTVQRADRAGSVLALHSPHRHPAVAQGWSSPVVAVLPSQVADAIRRALAEGWRPGELGADHWVGLEIPGGEAWADAIRRHVPPAQGDGV